MRRPPHGRGHLRCRPGGPREGNRILVPRADLEDALDEITIAYENAVAAADDGLLDFAPFDTLPDVIRLLRALVDGAQGREGTR